MKPPFAGAAAKAALRADAMARRDALDATFRRAASADIAARAIAIVAPLKPAVVAVYHAIRSEVDPLPVLEWALARGLTVVLPALRNANTMVFRRYRPGDPLAAGGFGTLSPPPDKAEIDPNVIVSPMVGFDRSGMRLGHGRGYYDRAILSLRARGLHPPLVGLAFSAQEVSAIPAESHDVRMDWIVTEKETLDLRHTA